MKSLKEIINEYDYDKSFPLFGETFTVSRERNIFSQIKYKYEELAGDSLDEFSRRFSNYKDIESMLSNLKTDFAYSVMNALDELKKDAISIGCYSLDDRAIISLCEQNRYWASYEDSYQSYFEMLKGIYEEHAYRLAQVYNRADYHPTLEVATLGGNLVDVVANQFTADIVNYIIGQIYSEIAAEKAAGIEDDLLYDFQEFFKIEEYKESILYSIWDCTANLSFIITNDLNEEFDLKLGGGVTIEDAEKAAAMFNNIKHIKMSPSDEKKCILSILNYNPYVYEYYDYILNKYFENTNEILAIAKYLNIYLDDKIKNALFSYAKDHIGNTFDSIKECRDLVKNRIAEFNLPRGSDSIAEPMIQEHIITAFKNYFKKNGGNTKKELNCVYNEALAIAADVGLSEGNKSKAFQPYYDKIQEIDEKFIKEQIRYINEIIGFSEEDAPKCRCEIEKRVKEYELAPEKARALFDIIDERVIKMDQEYRTVEGFLFPTKESAEKTRAVIDKNKELLNKSPFSFVFRREYTEQIEKIKSLPIVEKLILRYIAPYERQLSEFDEKCKNALLFDNELKGRKVPFKERLKAMLVSNDKLERDWKSVTHNGKYSIYDVMGIPEKP